MVPLATGEVCENGERELVVGRIKLLVGPRLDIADSVLKIGSETSIGPVAAGHAE